MFEKAWQCSLRFSRSPVLYGLKFNAIFTSTRLTVKLYMAAQGFFLTGQYIERAKYIYSVILIDFCCLPEYRLRCALIGRSRRNLVFLP